MTDITKAEEKGQKKAAAVALLEAKKDDLAKLVGPELIEHFLGAALACITKTPKLLECRPGSFYQAAHHCAVLGLMPGPTDEVYLIPYGKAVQAQVGYKGYITLACRHPDVRKCDGRVVYASDTFEFDEVTGLLRHGRDWQREQTDDDIIGAWAAVWRHDDPRDQPSYLLVMSRAEIEKRRAKSQQKDGNFWTDWYPAMCRKTVLRALLNGGTVPRSTQLAAALAVENEQEFEKPAEVRSVRSEPLAPVADGFAPQKEERIVHREDEEPLVDEEFLANEMPDPRVEESAPDREAIQREIRSFEDRHICDVASNLKGKPVIHWEREPTRFQADLLAALRETV